MTEPVIRVVRSRLGVVPSRADCYCYVCGHYKRCACSVRVVCNGCGGRVKVLQSAWSVGSPCLRCEFGTLIEVG